MTNILGVKANIEFIKYFILQICNIIRIIKV